MARVARIVNNEKRIRSGRPDVPLNSSKNRLDGNTRTGLVRNFPIRLWSHLRGTVSAGEKGYRVTVCLVLPARVKGKKNKGKDIAHRVRPDWD